MLREYLGKPLTAILDPFGKFESFAHHNNAMLREFLDRFGFEYEFVSSTEQYKAGAFDAALKNVLRHNQDILDIMRSEEHTSELQSLMRTSYAVFCLKKKTTD